MKYTEKIPTAIEPLKSNRWIIKFQGMDISPYLFRKYKMFNEGENIIFTTEFMETIAYSYNPKDIFNITNVTIEYLSPIGDVINGLSFTPKGINFKRKHSYSDDNLMITKLRFIIDVNTLSLLYETTKEENLEPIGLSDDDYIKQAKASMNI